MMLSILALNEYDSHLWDNFSVPSALDKQTAIDYILESCAELELLYSDPEIVKYMIRNWVRTEGHIWDKLAETLDLDYNPIYNLDVTWEETRTPNLTRTRTPNLTETRTPNLTETRTPDLTETRSPDITETTTPADTTTEKVAGYNSDTFQNARQTERGGTITERESGTESTRTTGTESRRESGTETQTRTGSETERETGTDTITTRRYGNQGVTMTQDMIAKEREVAKFNLYEYIANSFKNRFCLMVY